MQEKIKYFVFSSTQFNDKKEICKKLGKTYKPGTVLINGSYKQYTDILESPKHPKYSDTIIIASGDIQNMKYKVGVI